MHSPTYGEVTIPEIARIIKQQVETDPHSEWNVMIGTDSQNFDKTKVVVVIALHHVGKGGIFFYQISRVRRINNVGQKLLYETQLSLEYANELMDAFEELELETGFEYNKLLNFGIHVDAGQNGPSKQVIPEIIGWINSCGYKAVVKPDSYAASAIANKFSK